MSYLTEGIQNIYLHPKYSGLNKINSIKRKPLYEVEHKTHSKQFFLKKVLTPIPQVYLLHFEVVEMCIVHVTKVI